MNVLQCARMRTLSHTCSAHAYFVRSACLIVRVKQQSGGVAWPPLEPRKVRGRAQCACIYKRWISGWHAFCVAIASWKRYFVAPPPTRIPVHHSGCDRCPARDFSLWTEWSMQNVHLRPPKARMLRNLLADQPHPLGEGLG